ncbi:hypothetical protein KEM60_00466 [Austwickia sp. TVS 96-490-7B]|uniref:GntR family transcriptional regulator n=1 Tax=Austwickia sp. TVS 96-490-7B TaxID=2830843 RepID=UPI001C57D630|nr:GntR family transcriptional regulator [Austwickia sp. TVS 96-490-7B]MBW3084279.1 hypothetical protein [Austwickia sp. TVS 96-490-7B]
MLLWPPRRSTRNTRVDEAYIFIREAIVTGTYAPGVVLRESEVATAINVQRDCVREALHRLEATGLITPGPRDSRVVTDADLDVALDAQAVVAKMHRLAIELATPRFTHSDFVEMRAANQRFADAIVDGDVDECLAADDAFHDVAVHACGNSAVATVLEQFTPVIRRLERLRFGAIIGRESILVHHQIIDLCEAGNAAAAADKVEGMWQALSRVSFPAPRGRGSVPPPFRGGNY